MPKLIKDIEEIISQSAYELFGELGYKNSDMKNIAKRAGIAVGTLYNYYPNKKELFLDVFKKSWNNTFEKMDNVMYMKVDDIEKLKMLLEVMYIDMQKRRGMGNELVKANIISKEESIEYIKETVYKKVRVLVDNIEEEKNIHMEESIKNRIIKTLFLNIVTIGNEYKGEEEENLKFIYFSVNKFFS